MKDKCNAAKLAEQLISQSVPALQGKMTQKQRRDLELQSKTVSDFFHSDQPKKDEILGQTKKGTDVISILEDPRILVKAFETVQAHLVSAAEFKLTGDVSVEGKKKKRGGKKVNAKAERRKDLCDDAIAEKVSKDLETDLSLLIGGLVEMVSKQWLVENEYLSELPSRSQTSVPPKSQSIQKVIDLMTLGASGFQAVVEQGRPSENPARRKSASIRRIRENTKPSSENQELYAFYQAGLPEASHKQKRGEDQEEGSESPKRTRN